MTAQAPSKAPARHGGASRFSSTGLKRAGEVMDFQIELESLATAQEADAAKLEREIAQDAADDRRRFLKYRAVEHAIRHGDMVLQLAAFHSLVAHVEADELREDSRRIGRVPALRLLARKLHQLRSIFRTDFVPLIVKEIR